MRIELIRHGLTVYGEEKRYCGRADVPLSEKGRSELLPAEHMPEKVYVSGLKRTAETAELIFPGARQIPVTGLMEMDFGEFDGRTYEEMKEDPEYVAWLDGGCESRCPGGESKKEFTDRVCEAFSGLIKERFQKGEKEAVIVAHGGTQMAVMSRFCREKKDYFSWQLECGQGYLLECDSDLSLSVIGITDHRR